MDWPVCLKKVSSILVDFVFLNQGERCRGSHSISAENYMWAIQTFRDDGEAEIIRMVVYSGESKEVVL